MKFKLKCRQKTRGAHQSEQFAPWDMLPRLPPWTHWPFAPLHWSEDKRPTKPFAHARIHNSGPARIFLFARGAEGGGGLFTVPHVPPGPETKRMSLGHHAAHVRKPVRVPLRGAVRPLRRVGPIGMPRDR